MTTSTDAEELDINERVKQWRAQRDREFVALRNTARASYHAMETWSGVNTPEEWQAVVERARERYDNGAFLLDRLGAERFLEPEVMAVLLVLRKRLVQASSGSAADMLAIDVAVLAYYQTLRVTGWIGNLALLVEHEFFGQDGPGAKLKERHGYQVDGLKVEESIQRMSEELMPLLERANRMMLRNLATLRQRPVVHAMGGSQVNVADRQVNIQAATTPQDDASPEER